jgi:transposase InsO family protein
MYLAIVMDLYSRRIVGWHIDKRMTGDLVAQALTQASRYFCESLFWASQPKQAAKT